MSIPRPPRSAQPSIILGAQAVAAAARASGAYTDLHGFTLRCSDCGVGVTGQSGAVAHAKASGHAAFHEYKAPAAITAVKA